MVTERYVGVGEISENWGISERTVRYYCNTGRVAGAYLGKGDNWFIPEMAEKPARTKRSVKIPSDLRRRMAYEKDLHIKGGIYHKLQIELTYNSNHIEGSKLTEEQTRLIFENIELHEGPLNRNDLIESSNHFMTLDYILDTIGCKLTQKFIKSVHKLLKQSTADQYLKGYAVGEYKTLANEVGGMETVLPKDVPAKMEVLLEWYNSIVKPTLEDIVEFHARFEAIHPFLDGNGRVGRLIMFRECIKHGVVPFVITDSEKDFYYRGLREWNRDRRYLLDTCLAAQDNMVPMLEYFGIKYKAP